MDEYLAGTGFGMQPFFLLGCQIQQAAGNTTGQYYCAEPHVDQRHGDCAHDQSAEQDADTPVDEFSLEAFKGEGLLKPLIHRKLFGHQLKPKKALTIRADTTKKTHEPPHPINSLFMS